VAKSNHANSEGTIHTFTQKNQVKQQNFNQKVHPQLPWPKVGCVLSLFSPTLMTDNQPTFLLNHSDCFVSNLLHSQPLLSDAQKVDVILYVLLFNSMSIFNSN
jgi:hypothetical protein